MINSIFDLQKLVVNNFFDWESLGDVKAVYRGDFVLFNYTAMAAMNNRWNFFETVSRGLILNRKTGYVVSRPPDKFFNWGESGRVGQGKVQQVFEKLDGSLGILYRDCGTHYICTRGSFTSDQAVWATKWLRTNHDLSELDETVTLYFEIIYPENRIVVDYGQREDVVLLGARSMRSGQYLPWLKVEEIAEKFSFSLPAQYEFTTIDEIAKITQKLDMNSEGFVVHMDNGEWWKFKGEEYRRIHKIISTFSFKNTLLATKEGKLGELLRSVPDCFLDPVLEHIDTIEATELEILQNVEAAFAIAPKDDRKTFAQWVMATHKQLSPYLFARLDGKPLKPVIYKQAFKGRSDE